MTIDEPHVQDLLGRLADDAALSRERSVECQKIGNITGMQIAGQICDDLDEAQYVIRRIKATGASEVYQAFMAYVRQCNAAKKEPTFTGAGSVMAAVVERALAEAGN